MALNLVFRYRLVNPAGLLLAGQYINTYWNDVTELLEVYEYDDAADTTGTLMTSGPDIGARRVDYTLYNSAGRTDSGYSIFNFCDGNDLNSFKHKSTFPYADKIVQLNNVACSLNVCDLTITDYVTTDASDNVTADGTITVTATSSNGPIKYSLNPEFDYATEGQISNEFIGLIASTYTIYAKDSIGCFDEITAIVGIPLIYNPKYRLDYPDRNGIPTRVDIVERGYEGEPEIVEGAAEPFVLKYNGNDINKFKPVIASEAKLTLLSYQHFHFLPLFTQDERKYQLRYYKDFGNTIPGFTPDVLADVSDWLETSDAYSWTGLSITLNGSASANKKYAIYNFAVGREYSFDYDFSATISGYMFAQIQIQITNAAGADLGANLLINTPSTGSYTGTHTFVAPEGADRVRVYIVQSSVSGSYTINSITNETLPGDPIAAGLELKWLGYVISSNYQEVYGPTPYPVTIVATDGLADLQKQKFLDTAGNRYRDDIVTMKAITEILKKTDLGINIVAAVNRIEESMTSNGLKESKFEANTFYEDNESRTPKDCFYVLEQIIKIFACRLYQRNGKWIIQTIEEAVHEFAYSEYSSDGSFLTTGTIYDILEIQNRIVAMEAAFRNRDQVLEVIPAYGVLFFEHSLVENPSLVKSYSFEQEDVYETPEGKAAFTNWGTDVSSAPGAEFGIKQTNTFEGKYNFYYKPPNPEGSDPEANQRIVLSSLVGAIEYDSTDLFEYRFEYAVIIKSARITSRQPMWIRLKWSLKVGDFYYSEALGDWTEDYQYNDIYVDSYNDSQEFKIVAPMRQVDELTLESFQVEFVMFDNYNFEFESLNENLDNLKALPTVDLLDGYRIKGKMTYNGPIGVTVKYLYWQLVSESWFADDQDEFRVQPNDYDDITNQKVWVLQDEAVNRSRNARRGSAYDDHPPGEMVVTYWYMDNVVFRLLPGGFEPPANITVEKTNNANIKIDYEDQFLLNDIDIDNINNSERIYRNFFKQLDGSPTQTWERTYRPGSGKLLDLYANDYTSQYKNPGFKLTGSLLAGREITYGTVLKELFDNNKLYMFMGFELRDRSYSVGFDLSELKDVVNDPDSPDIDAGFTIGYSLGFRA